LITQPAPRASPGRHAAPRYTEDGRRGEMSRSDRDFSWAQSGNRCAHDRAFRPRVALGCSCCARTPRRS